MEISSKAWTKGRKIKHSLLRSSNLHQKYPSECTLNTRGSRPWQRMKDGHVWNHTQLIIKHESLSLLRNGQSLMPLAWSGPRWQPWTPWPEPVRPCSSPEQRWNHSWLEAWWRGTWCRPWSWARKRFLHGRGPRSHHFECLKVLGEGWYSKGSQERLGPRQSYCPLSHTSPPGPRSVLGWTSSSCIFNAHIKLDTTLLYTHRLYILWKRKVSVG